MALKKHALIILIFSISSLVVFMLASQDLRYVQISQAGEKLATTTEDKGTNSEGIGTIGSDDGDQAENNPDDVKADDNDSIATSGGYTAGVSKADVFAPTALSVDEYLVANNLKNNYGIAFVDLKYTGVSYYNSEETIFKPASIYKVPLAMLILKKAELGEVNLGDLVLHEGEQKPLKTVMELMIKESNNDAMGIFEGQLGGYNTSQEFMLQEFGVQVKRIGQRTSAKDLEVIFRKLYATGDGAYLSQENRDYLIDLMLNATPINRNRIPEGVNKFNEKHDTKLTTATKIGNLTGVYQDAGFIFGKNSDYLLIVLNKNLLKDTEGIEHISNITQLILEGLES